MGCECSHDQDDKDLITSRVDNLKKVKCLFQKMKKLK